MEFDKQVIRWIYEEYKKFKNDSCSQEEKNRRYSDLINNLESLFSIPHYREDGDETDQQAFDLYQELSTTIENNI